MTVADDLASAFMTITSTDYSSTIPRGLVIRTAKPGTCLGETMTE